MKKTNKIYSCTNCDNSQLICYSLKDAIEYGVQSFKDLFYNKYLKDYENEDELNEFIENEIRNDNIRGEFIIEIISCNRLEFESEHEILSYLIENIDNVSNDNLYDFLLTMVNSEVRFYDHKGNYISNDINTQNCGLECYNSQVSFSEYSCKERKFQFAYEYKGIDTLYNNKYIKPFIKEDN